MPDRPLIYLVDGRVEGISLPTTDELLGTRYYDLGYPNREIEQSFSYWLARDLGHVPDGELGGANVLS